MSCPQGTLGQHSCPVATGPGWSLRHRAPLFPQWFRSAVVKEDAMPADLMTLLFSNIDPIYEFHRGFLCELEQRLALW